MKAMFEATVGVPVKYEMLYCGEWQQNLLLADSYCKGRVFLAGDAVHLMIPTGGLGMNTGVGDAVDLSWKLAATLKGWGGPGLLASYETERRQIGDRNIGASRYASLGRRLWRSQFRPNIRDNTLEGRATRDNLKRIAEVEQRKSNEMIGAELGYRYSCSPIIWEEPGGPEQLFREYHPTTWPGARLPHVWLDDGTPMQDHIACEGYTLLRLGRSKTDASSIEHAFRLLGAHCRFFDVPDDAARQIYGYDLLLLRPDLHLVWRGTARTRRQSSGGGGHRSPERVRLKTARPNPISREGGFPPEHKGGQPAPFFSRSREGQHGHAIYVVSDRCNRRGAHCRLPSDHRNLSLCPRSRLRRVLLRRRRGCRSLPRASSRRALRP